jgi:hypothetical protein
MADSLTAVEKAVEAAAQAVVDDTVSYVKAHPQYQQVIQTLGEKAIAALLAGL